MQKGTTQVCWLHHLGPWAAQQQRLEAAIAAIQSGLWKPEMQASRSTPARQLGIVFMDDGEDAPEETPAYQVTAGGVAVFDVVGFMMKPESKFGGTSTVKMRQGIRDALVDEKVRAIMMRIESPGGHLSGTPELAQEIAAADKKKPVYAHIDEIGASAAYWIAAQSRRITANRTAEIGSIGVLCVVYDLSKSYEMQGVRTIVLSTGPDKGAGARGAPITDEQLVPMKEAIADAGGLFREAVSGGRRFSAEQYDAVSSGRTWTAPAAQKLKLIDAVSAFEDAIGGLEEDLAAKDAGGRMRARRRSADARARGILLDGGEAPAK